MEILPGNKKGFDIMKDVRREILEIRELREDSKFRMNSLLFCSKMDRFDDKVIKDVFLALRYLNGVMETAINQQGITENDLSEDDRQRYIIMKQADSISDVMEEMVALLSDEDLSTGSE